MSGLRVLEQRDLARALRDRAKTGEPELVADIGTSLDRVVHIFEREGGAMPAAEAKSETGKQVPEQVWLERSARNVRTVDDRDRRGADAARDPDLLVALKQRVIQRTVGVHLALEDRVLDAPAAQVEHLALQPCNAGLERTLGRQGGPIFRLKPVDAAAFDIGSLPRNLPIELLDPRAQADHFGMLRLHERPFVLVLGLEGGARLA
jgi:hypothetical protein